MLQKSSTSTIVKILGMIIGLFVSVFLARTIGAEGLGIINLSNKITTILIVFGLIGMRQVIVKEIAIAHNRKNYNHIASVMLTSYLTNGGVTLAITLLFILITPWLADNVFNEPNLTYPLIIFLIVMTPQVYSRIFSSALVGYRKIWQSNLVEQTLSIAITGLLLLAFFISKVNITINLVAICYAIGRLGVTLSVGIYWKKLFSFEGKPKIITKELLPVSLPLFVVSISGILLSNADAIILGWLSSSREIGLYTVAAKLALLSTIFLQITNAAVAPKVAALFDQNEHIKLQIMIRQVTKGLTIIGFAPFVIFLFFGNSILSIWGSEFIEAYWILLILSFGQLVNIATGAVGVIMIMTGHEKVQSKISFIFAIINIILNVILIKKYGALGAAIATATVVISSNFLKVFFVKKLVGINTLIISK